MADTQETVADIIAEMRGMGNYQRYSGDHARVLAGRLEAAHKRERGDAAKLREALSEDNDKERLTRWYNQETWKGASALTFGRKMPFGKHKGMYMYCLIVKHPMYLNWILNNTGFKLTQDESWWKQKIDDALDRYYRYRLTKLCSGLASQMHLGGVDNIENPHWMVE